MNLYEKLIILDPNLDEKAREEQIGKVEEVITKQGGEILKSENLGRRKLAYEIKKRQKGDYILLLFKAPPSTIAELERFCRVVEPILKFIITKLKKKKQIAAVMSSLPVADVKGKADDTKSVQEQVPESNRNDVPAGEDMTMPNVKPQQDNVPLQEDKKNVQ